MAIEVKVIFFLVSAISIGMLIGCYLAMKTADLIDWVEHKIWHYKRRRFLD